MRLLFEQKSYINQSLPNPLHSVTGGCVKRKTSTLTLVNLQYLKSSGYNVRATSAISRPRL